MLKKGEGGSTLNWKAKAAAEKVFHILHQLGGFDNDDARISDLQNSGGRSRQHWASTRQQLRCASSHAAPAAVPANTGTGCQCPGRAGGRRGPHLIMIDESDALNQIGSWCQLCYVTTLDTFWDPSLAFWISNEFQTLSKRWSRFLLHVFLYRQEDLNFLMNRIILPNYKMPCINQRAWHRELYSYLIHISHGTKYQIKNGLLIWHKFDKISCPAFNALTHALWKEWKKETECQKLNRIPKWFLATTCTVCCWCHHAASCAEFSQISDLALTHTVGHVG